VLIFYYTLKSWEGLAGHEIFDHIPAVQRLVVIAGVAAGATIGTHALASAIQHKKFNKGIWVAIIMLVSSLSSLVILSLMHS
jgi:hypothetical protein